MAEKENYILFGAGVMGMAAVNYFGKEKIVAVIDNDSNKIGTLFEGIPVISFGEYIKKYKEIPVIVAIYTKRYLDAKKQLEEAGVYNYFTAPPLLHGFDIPEKMAEKMILTTPKRVFFYGINPLSIRMYKWLKTYSNQACFFIKTLKEKNHERVNGGKGEYFSSEMNDILKDDIIVITTNEEEEHIREILRRNYSGQIYDIYQDAFPVHHELSIYKNRHKGQRCFVIGNGPSLKAEDLDKIADCNDKSFAMNGIFHIYQKTHWRPSYYVVADSKALRILDKYIQLYADESFFIADLYHMDLKVPEIVKRFSVLAGINSDGNFQFSSDITKGIAGGRTVTYSALQIACYMGFSDIYLVGMDFSWGEDGRDSHFCKEYSNDQIEKAYRTVDILNKDEIRCAYMAAKSYADEHKIKIYNATRGGYLDVFERVDFDSLF